MKLIAKISLLAVLIISTAVNAYEFLQSSWASNNIEFYTGFNTNEDGTSATNYQSALNNAITSWNNNSNFQYSINSAYKDPCTLSYNSVRFKNDICGTAFGATVLAVAGGSHYSGTTNKARAYIIFNSLNSWGIHDNSSNSPTDFKRVALHEVGHTLGLDHSGTTASIMYYLYQNVTTLQTDDINGIRAIYGLTDDHSNNPSNATAISFNTNISGNIEIGGDDDYFRISVPAGGGYLDIYSTGSTDTYGYLLDSSGNVIAENDDSGVGDNFRFEGTAVAGTYYILVEGYYSNTIGNYNLRADFTAIPNTPSTPSASDGTYTDKVRISWSSVSGANSYIIYRCTSTSSSSCSQISTDSSSPYDYTSATIGTTYYYRLKACSGSSGTGICSDYSNYDTGYRAIVAPNTPTVSDGDYTDKVRISWSSVSGANSYIIYRCTSTNSSSCSQISTDSSSPYNDTSSTAGIIYYYRLTACSGSSGTGICSNYSNYDTGYRAIVAPNTPTASDGDYTDKVRISWSSVSGANSYIIYRCTSTSSSSCSQIGTDSSSPYDDASATIGTTYYYRLKACSGSSGSGNCSSYSNYNQGYRAVATPNTPTASDGDYTDKVRISWSSVSGANSYRIYRSTSASGTYSQIATDSTSPYDYTSAIIGTTYYYKLRACTGSNGSGACSDYSNYDSGYRAIVAPNTPAASDGDYTDKVRISWSSVSGANSYIIYRCTSTSSSSCSQIDTDSSSPYDDTGVTAGIIYYYRLTACSGSSGSSNCSSYSSYNQGHRAITAAPSIAFSPAAITAVVGADIGNITVINIGGVVASYSIAPAITNDLSFNINTGAISGTPSAAASATYIVIATNSFGNSAATISIEVKSFSLDIDGNGSLAAPNDGLIIFKYLLNSNANNLHTTIANDAATDRKTTAQLKTYLDNAGTILDVDGNGTINAPNDGLIIFKYLLNSNANNLHTTITNDAATDRKTTTNLKSYLDKYR